ncbi:MAG: Outer membrane protein assembly factor BamB [Phycisphaerae bacterium]|nr:Outer membrane protein assembly factor BamB [Phycisphaerae bacterium]
MKRIGATLTCVLLAAHSLAWGLTAEEVSRKTGVAGGLCSLPRLGDADAALAMELAARPTFVVHALAGDAKTAAALRAQADAAGLLGKSLYVETATSTALPYADRLADLLVATDLRDADLTPELRAEWLRVLAPVRGAAMVGRSKAAGAGLSADALKAWVKDLPGAKVLADDEGLWAILRAPLPAGSQPWNHRCHDPGNSQVSDDTTLQPPFLVQWWGMPRQEGFWGTTVVAGGGRMFSMRSSRRKENEVVLTARSLTSGIVLWQKVLHPAEDKKAPHGGYIPGRSCMVVETSPSPSQGEGRGEGVRSRLLLIDGDGVAALDAETGEPAARIDGPKKGSQIKWIALTDDGLLAVLAGDAEQVLPITYQTVSGNPNGGELAVYKDGKQLWHKTAAGPIDERAIAIRGGRLYDLADEVGVECRDLKTGEVLWTNGETEIQTAFRPPPPKALGQFLVSQPTMVVTDDVLILRAVWAKQITVLGRADGQTLWSRPAGGGRALTALAVDGLWLGGRESIDLKTGKNAKGPRFIQSGCGPTSATPGLLITCFGAVEDTKTGAIVRPADLKSPCDVGTLVSDGLMVTVPSECACNFEMKGYRVLASAGRIAPHLARPWEQRLSASAQAKPVTPLPVTDADWVTWRHDAARSGGTSAAVGEGEVKVLWQWKPAVRTPAPTDPTNIRLTPDFMPTAPVAAAGRVWFASADGVVRCLNAADGKEAWNFPTGAMQFAPPTISDGRALVGGGDGRVRCLDASTGARIWQLASGPPDRRVFWFGHLVSTWPLMGGVAVDGGVGYAVAGYQADNGLFVCAFDPVTGKARWERNDSGTGGAGGANQAYSNGGAIAVGGGKLWLTATTAAPASFELANGDWKPMGHGSAFGSQIGVLADKWALRCGRRASETQDTLSQPLHGTGLAAWPVGGGRPVTLGESACCLPAWDAGLVVMPPRGGLGNLAAVPTDKLTAWLAEQTDAQPARGAKPGDWVPMASWSAALPGAMPVAFALAKDQTVAACRIGAKFVLVGFSRADGKQLWKFDLPAQPVMNALAIDRDGRVLVSLCDGSLLCAGR